MSPNFLFQSQPLQEFGPKALAFMNPNPAAGPCDDKGPPPNPLLLGGAEARTSPAAPAATQLPRPLPAPVCLKGMLEV